MTSRQTENPMGKKSQSLITLGCIILVALAIGLSADMIYELGYDIGYERGRVDTTTAMAVGGPSPTSPVLDIPDDTPYSIGHICERFTGDEITIHAAYIHNGGWSYNVEYIESGMYINGLAHELISKCRKGEK